MRTTWGKGVKGEGEGEGRKGRGGRKRREEGEGIRGSGLVLGPLVALEPEPVLALSIGQGR